MPEGYPEKPVSQSFLYPNFCDDQHRIIVVHFGATTYFTLYPLDISSSKIHHF